MFLPIGDSPNRPETPWLTWLLIAVNVAIHVSLWPAAFRSADPDSPAVREYVHVLAAERGVVPQRVSQADMIRYHLGFKPGRMTLWSAFTSMFLHGGLAHLLGNMLFLWIFGDNVEHRMGGFAFLFAYFGTGVVAALGDAVLRAGSLIPSIGASGAISGVLGFYFVWFPRNRVRTVVFLFPFLVDILEIPARWVLGFYVVAQNLLPLLLTGGAGGISYGAHIGGFAGGAAFAIALAGWSTARPRRTRADGSRSTTRGAPSESLAQAFERHLAAGRLESAADTLFALPRSVTRRELGLRHKVLLGDALAAAGHGRAALTAFQRALADHPTAPGRSRAHLGAAATLLYLLGEPTAAYQHLWSAMEEDPTDDDVVVARRLRADLEKAVHRIPRHHW